MIAPRAPARPRPALGTLVERAALGEVRADLRSHPAAALDLLERLAALGLEPVARGVLA